jgi:hypothetical protein
MKGQCTLLVMPSLGSQNQQLLSSMAEIDPNERSCTLLAKGLPHMEITQSLPLQLGGGD